jgi:hypothetical protein
MPESIPVFVVNQNNFNWLTFLLGGAAGSFIGALIILSIERFWVFYKEKRKQKMELEKASFSLTMENMLNYRYCYLQMKRIEKNSNNILGLSFIPFKTFWLDTFRYNFLDPYDDDQIITLLLINNIESDIEKIKSKYQWVDAYKNFLFYKYSSEELNVLGAKMNVDEYLSPYLKELMDDILILESRRILNIHISKYVADKSEYSKKIKKSFASIIKLVDNSREFNSKEDASKSSGSK